LAPLDAEQPVVELLGGVEIGGLDAEPEELGQVAAGARRPLPCDRATRPAPARRLLLRGHPLRGHRSSSCQCRRGFPEKWASQSATSSRRLRSIRYRRIRPLRSWVISPAASSTCKWRVVVCQAWAKTRAIAPALIDPPLKCSVISTRRRAGCARAPKTAS